MRRAPLLAPLLFGTLPALAQEAPPKPERGPVAVGMLELAPLRYPASDGDAQQALKTFLEAHAAHKRGDLAAALDGYLAFRGMAGRHDLPPRYLATVEARLVVLLKAVRKRYEGILDLYNEDRAKGLAEARRFAERHGNLPEGKALLQLWHTDELEEAIKLARAKKAQGEGPAAAKDLAVAVGRWVYALDPYEAKRLVLELGGPDLFRPGERIPGDETEKKEGGGESTIEINGG